MPISAIKSNKFWFRTTTKNCSFSEDPNPHTNILDRIKSTKRSKVKTSASAATNANGILTYKAISSVEINDRRQKKNYKQH